jgi:hypothetical protein
MLLQRLQENSGTKQASLSLVNAEPGEGGSRCCLIVPRAQHVSAQEEELTRGQATTSSFKNRRQEVDRAGGDARAKPWQSKGCGWTRSEASLFFRILREACSGSRHAKDAGSRGVAESLEGRFPFSSCTAVTERGERHRCSSARRAEKACWPVTTIVAQRTWRRRPEHCGLRGRGELLHHDV